MSRRMDEYLVVRFRAGWPESRRVVLNGALTEWRTNTRIMLQAGTYVVSLEDPPNYSPASITVHLFNTTIDDPKTIQFF